MKCYRGLALIVGLVTVDWTSVVAQDVVPSWYPAHVGDTWVYQHESRDGTRPWTSPGGIADPQIERWKTEETILGLVPILQGTFLTKRTRVLDHEISAGCNPCNDDGWKRDILAESHYLIHQDCLYALDGSLLALDVKGHALRALDQDNHLRPEFDQELASGDFPPEFCFPLELGKRWGKLPEETWEVTGVNSVEPMAPDGGRTFHLVSYPGSGEVADVWFTPGVGIVQEASIHHGTYEETDAVLLRTIIGQKARDYRVTPAGSVPEKPI